MNQSFRDKILKYDRLVPRYTSYPTAPHFQTLNDEAVYRNHLTALPNQSLLSLYLHVPFCPKMCLYCGCNTKITKRYAPVEDYTHLILREIDMLADILSPTHLVKNIHFGGGSPGMLRAVDFTKIMDTIRSKFHVTLNANIAIEIDPRNITESRIAAYAASGVNRISLGVQDFNDKVLAAVNREQPFELSQNAVALFRAHGINEFNFDLLYGLPHQTVNNMKETIDSALSLNPDRISLFGYAHVPWMKKHMRLIDEGILPDKNLRYDLFEAGAEKLQESGYIPIGIDHFAKKDDAMARHLENGTLHRNFQGYTTEQTDALIGIGASSIGKLPEGYMQNAVAINQYRDAILAGRFAIQKFCPLSKEDILRGDIIEQLMCNFKVDIKKTCLDHGFPIDYLDHLYLDLYEFIADGFVSIVNERTFHITPLARQLARVVCSIFDEYLQKAHDTPHHAKAI